MVAGVLGLGFLLGLLPTAPTPGDPVDLGPVRPLAHHSARRWMMQEGLPQNSITGIVQTHEGYLWLATFGGLARFDGVNFQTYDPTNGLDDPRLTALAQDQTGALWIGFQSGGVGRFVNGQLERPEDQPPALQQSTIASLEWGPGGAMWVAARAGVFRWDAQGWTEVIAAELSSVRPFGPKSARAGGIAQSALVVDDVVTLDASPALQIFREDDGTEWRVMKDRLDFVRGAEVRTVARWSHAEWLSAPPITDAAGALWFSLGDRVYRFQGRPRLLADPSGALSPREFQDQRFGGGIRRLFMDRERNVWVGTDGDGLWRLRPEPLDNLADRNDLPRASIHGVVAVDPERFWVATACQGVFLLGPSGVERRVLSDTCVGGIALAPDGTLWAAGASLFALPDPRADGGGPVRRVPLPDTSGATAVLVDRSGRVWVGMQSGLFQLEGDAVRRVPAVEGSVVSLTEAPTGELWVGMSGRVMVLGADAARTLEFEQGVPNGAVRAVLHDPDGSVWLGSYGGGLTRIRPGAAPRRLSRSQGLFDNFVSALFLDPEGNLWVNANRGVFRILRADLDALPTTGEVQSLPLPSGEAMAACPSVALLQDRYAVVATIHGPIQLDLSEASRNDTKPVVTILAAQLDDVTLTPGRWLEAPPGRGRLDVEFATAMLRQPRLTSFEYRLHGLEGETWHRTDNRSPSARYENLPAGQYRFELLAINEDGVRGPTVTLPFALRPHITSTPGFRGGLALIALMLGWIGHRLRTRGMARRNRALKAEIAQRIEAESALSEREAHYRRVFESSVNGFFVTDEEDRIVDVNPKGCSLLGTDAESLLGRSLDEALGRDDPPDLESSGRHLLGIEVAPCRRADGTEFLARIDTLPFPGSGHTRFLTTLVDVSPLIEAQAERQRLKEELLHSQRVQAVGRLAGGIAHDVNNMLTAIQGYASLAQESLDEGAPAKDVHHMLDQVLDGAQRTADITRQLLAFARRQVVSPVGLSLTTMVRDAEPFLRGVTRESVDLQLRLQDDLPIVRADRTQLQQVLMNLVINATHAMPEGGELVIETGTLDRAALAERYPHLGLKSTHAYLAVDDEGCGMTPEVMAQIFDPFFTTKKVGEGTGLGLSAVQGIVSQAGGHIEVRSAPGEGARFEILLPVALATMETPSPTGLRAWLHDGGGRTLLYVDDDDDVRVVTDRALSHAHYQVQAFRLPDDLLEAAAEMPEPPAALVTDVLMPGMQGPELAARLRSRWPELKVLFVSAYAEGIRDLPEGMAFLAKPYRQADLLGALKDLLDAS
ncbi:MAG: PAS domain S-box protein [Deltaproteobacteria bacterium]|nr:PAS domain S-box protein [Deltaproteobacteria bacterium]